MTTILPPNELAFYRAISRTAAVLLVCLRIDELYPGRTIADFEIADILEQDQRTINKQLRSLSAAGLMLEQRENRYVVTVQGRNTLFSNRQPALLSIEETQKIDGESFPRAQIVHQSMIDDDSESIHDSEFESSSITERAKCAKYLEATHLLFGTAVNLSGILDCDPNHVLAWISKAYADRRNLVNPQGLVYSRLKKNERPPVYLLKNPTQGLPDEYLVAVGLMEASAVVDEEPVEMGTVCELSEAESLLKELAERSTEISAVCISWSALSFEDGVLRVGIKDPRWRELWERRMGQKANQLLSEITQLPARVEFVVMEMEVE